MTTRAPPARGLGGERRTRARCHRPRLRPRRDAGVTSRGPNRPIFSIRPTHRVVRGSGRSLVPVRRTASPGLGVSGLQSLWMLTEGDSAEDVGGEAPLGLWLLTRLLPSLRSPASLLSPSQLPPLALARQVLMRRHRPKIQPKPASEAHDLELHVPRHKHRKPQSTPAAPDPAAKPSPPSCPLHPRSLRSCPFVSSSCPNP